MTDIVEFLTARLDEDEAAATAHLNEVALALYNSATAHPRRKPCEDFTTLPPPVQERYRALVLKGQPAPARVLAEVKAKRAIVALHQISSRPEEWGDVRHHPDQDWPRTNYMGQLTGGTVYSCGICDIGVNLDADGPLWRAEEACETILWMAVPHAAHPDYKQAWSVE